MTIGRVCSIDTLTMVDGAGRRAMVFLHGCPLRCLFCANPETSWVRSSTTSSDVSVEQVLEKLKRLQSYQLDGITVSGGEPLVQPQFTAALMREARAQLGWTCTLDTSGCGTRTAVSQVLDETDHVLFCIKSAVPATYTRLTGRPITRALSFARHLAERNLPWHLRYVLVPGVTDGKGELQALVAFAKQQPSLKAVELLPYHRLGLHKWEALGLSYPMAGTPMPTEQEMADVASRIRAAGLQCIL